MCIRDRIRPVGGNVVAHTSTYRIYFKKFGKKRIARMVDSPHHPEQEVIFALSEAGVVDPEDGIKKKTIAKKAEPETMDSEKKTATKKAEPETMDSEKETATKKADAEKTETNATKSE